MNKIDNYVILAEKSYKKGEYYFVTGFKTLVTMRKKFNDIKAFQKAHPEVKYDRKILCARDYDGNIIKIYDEV